MAQKAQKSAGRFAAGTTRSKAKTKAVAAPVKKAVKRVTDSQHEQMIEAAKKSPPPQAWFDEDISELRGPAR